MTFRQAAACLNVSPATAHRWWHRYADASAAERQSLAWAADRSSRPHRSPRLLDAGEREQAICEARRAHRLGAATGRRRDRSSALDGLEGAASPRSLAARRERPRGAAATSGRAPAICCTWTPRATRASSVPAIASPAIARSARATGCAGTRVGYDFAHAIVDDHSRLAYVELHDDERAATVTAFVERALDWFADARHPRQAADDRQRAGATSTTARCASCSPASEIKHLRTQPYRPQTNGKVERFHQTMAREWAYGITYRSTTTAQPEPCHTGSSTTTAQATQRDRQPATHQPRSQPPWAGQLGGRFESNPRCRRAATFRLDPAAVAQLVAAPGVRSRC